MANVLKFTLKMCPEHEEDNQYAMVLYMGAKCPYCELKQKYYRLEEKLREHDTGKSDK